MSNKHKHSEMIIAKVSNMNLVVFVKLTNMWSEMDDRSLIPDDVKFDYFLCLPQHKEACLHWLNDGDIQINRQSDVDFLDWDRPSREWKAEVSFMFSHSEFRIKPKKEKRLIAVCGNIIEFANKDLYYPESVQLIEIEVEV